MFINATLKFKKILSLDLCLVNEKFYVSLAIFPKSLTLFYILKSVKILNVKCRISQKSLSAYCK